MIQNVVFWMDQIMSFKKALFSNSDYYSGAGE